MSRSCQSGMPSMTGTIAARTTRASPAMRSDRIGFFLCGIALEPFWPDPNASDSSRTSVRWPCRTSSAIASQTVAMIASADTHSLIESRSTTWVEASAGRRSSASATKTSTDGSISEYVPTAPEMATTPTRVAGVPQPVPRPGGGEGEVGDPVPPDVGLGVHAVRAADLDRVPVRQPVVAQRRHQPVGLGQQHVGGVGQLHRERGVEQVGRRHAVVHVRGGRPGLGVVGPRGEEGDDVVLRRLLDLGDPLRRRRRRVAHRLDDVGGHPPRGGVRLQDQRLHPAPELVLVLVAPDPAHLGERVALDHRGTA